MFHILCRNFQHTIRTRELTTIHVNVCVLLQCQNPHLKSISNISESKNPQSITVDYLINSCGLPPERALSASKKFSFSSTEKPDAVVTYFQNHGLTKAQIAELISKRPSLLSSDPDKVFKPKIEFLQDLGVSGPTLVKVLVTDPTLLTRSMKNQIIPAFNFLKSFIGSNANILTAFKRSTWILQYNLDKIMGPNISILRDHGVPECTISKLLISQPRSLLLNTNRFKESVEIVEEMGFNSSRPMFVVAVRVLTGMSKSSWDGKLAIFRSLGLLEDEILSMFKRQPSCFLISEQKIRVVFKFFVEKLKWEPADMVAYPALLLLSLEKRVVPRCTVLGILSSKGVIRRKLKLSTMLKLAERDFLVRFVKQYHERIPEVVTAHNGGIEFEGFGEVGRIIFVKSGFRNKSASEILVKVPT